MQPSSNLARFGKQVDIFLQKVIVFVLTIAFVFLAFPVFVFFGIVFFLYRQCVILIAKIFRKDIDKPLTLLSSVMANVDRLYKHPFNILVSSVVLKGKPDIKEMRKNFKKQILERLDPKTGRLFYPEMFQNIRYFMSYPFWKTLPNADSEWITESCVRFYNDDENCETDFYKLQEVQQKLTLSKFQEDKPLLDMTVFSKYTPHSEKNAGLDPNETYFAVIGRLHHALGDGFAAAHFMNHLSLSTQTTADKDTFVKASDYLEKHSPKSSIIKKLFGNFILGFRILYDFTGILLQDKIHGSEGSLFKNLPQAESKLIRGNDEKIQKRMENMKFAFGKPFTTNDLNEIKSMYGVSGTAILLSGVIGGLRRSLFSKYSVIPEYIGFAMPLPLPGHAGKFRNKYFPALFYLPLAEPDSVKRLFKINDKLEHLKKSTQGFVFSLMTTTLYGQFPRWAFPYIQDKRSEDMEIIALSNVAGPKKMFDFLGYKIVDFTAGAGIPSEKHFPIVMSLSLGGRFRIGVIADSAVVESDDAAEMIMNNFFAEWNTLRELAVDQGIQDV